MSLRLVLISDTHYTPKISIPDGDVLVHAGDFTWTGLPEQIREFNRWLGSLPHTVKLVTAGNHDLLFERDPLQARRLITSATYLQDEGLQIGKNTFYFSPWSPTFGIGWAFNADRGEPIKKHWDSIPPGVDVLVTHGPPFGYGDLTERGERVGCEELADQIKNRIKPRLVVSGHIHEDHGSQLDENGVHYINASICDLRYRHTNSPIVIDL